ncbi:MAG TPA: aspartate aminotransferase family protein [Bryobacteraceae bacterium]|nr:aspartate aminotransferase family protein [Bryobacteraceae bacterium]
MTKQEIILAQQEYLFPAVFHYYKDPLVIARAKDQFVYDRDGNQYLDFFGGILTISVGHCNEKVNREIHRQVDTLAHVSTVFATEPQAALAKRIAEITPGGRLRKSFFTNSGTEANETAILAARCYTGSSEIIALRHSYHGRSSLAMSLTGQSSWRLGGALQPGIVHAHNAYCYRCPFGLTYPDCGVRCAQDVEDVIRSSTSGQVAGMIAEPIQGVGGFITPPREYFKIVAEIVRRHGGIFISDEVQTAWGRTGGKWFGIEQYGVTPDVITSAKGLGNGLPIGVTVATPEVADAIKGATISTFGGNPITTTAAKAVIDFIEQENLVSNAASTGAYLREKLEELARKHPLIGEVRGMGLMQAIELVRDRKTKEPATTETADLMERARANRLLVGKGGIFGNAIRISPPLNIQKADIDEFARLLDASLASVAAVPAGAGN